MSKIPQSPDELYNEFIYDMKHQFNTDLVSIVLYGSGAKGEYVRKKSDINFLVVLTEDGIKKLSGAFTLVKKWKKRNVAVPLFLTRDYIESSLDSFPIEFLNMKKFHKLVYGEDILSGLQISKDHLRLRCEEQIKGKLLHLREDFLRTLGNKRPLGSLLAVTIPAFASLFTALLEYKDLDVPELKRDTIIQTAESFSLNKEIFDRVLAVREKTLKLSKEELIQLTQDYIEEIRKLANIVDKW
ncbi:hypothetical protein JXQ31_03760 [candidate division KSB1 bacterium]|nr:hypothetical protein [candidate division KSB1 bacterium]